MTETWLPVVGHKDSYEVSDLGSVRSLDRTIKFPDGRQRFSKGRVLKQWKEKHGYLAVRLSSKNTYVHDVVLASFAGPKPKGACVRHGQLGSLNNSLGNVCYGTYSENNYDMVEHGVHGQASKTHCSKGHEFSEANTRIYTGRGYRERHCKTCTNDCRNAWRRNKRAA